MFFLPNRMLEHPTGSFKVPVPVPSADPDDVPLVCAQWNASYTPLVVGALSQLALGSTWEAVTDSERNVASGKAQRLMEIFGTASQCEPVPTPTTYEVNLYFSDGSGIAAPGKGVWTAASGWEPQITGFPGFYYYSLQVQFPVPRGMQVSISSVVFDVSDVLYVGKTVTMGSTASPHSMVGTIRSFGFGSGAEMDFAVQDNGSRDMHDAIYFDIAWGQYVVPPPSPTFVLKSFQWVYRVIP